MTVEISGAIPLSQNTASPAKADSSRETRASAFILARILEGGDVGNHLNEFHSLSRETDLELFCEGLYNLGVRLEQSGQVGVAGSVYSYLSAARALTPAPLPRGEGEFGQASVSESPSPPGRGNKGEGPDAALTIPSNIQRQAAERLAALRGEGAVGLRLEVLGRSFARQAMAPAPLIGMGVAGLAFRGMNLFAATQLANLSAGFLTRGPGLRILSGLVGFAAEVPAFTLTGRVMDHLLTGNVGAHGRAPLREELASAALVLGSLKLFGAAFGHVGAGLALPSARLGGLRVQQTAPLQIALQQAGMLTGIMAGHGLEVAFGLRERQAPSLFLSESLVTLAQFNVAGRLSHSVFGERYATLQQSLAMQAEAVGRVRGSELGVRSRVQSIIEQMRDRLNGPPLAGATAGGGRIGEEFFSGTSALRHSDTLQDDRLYMVGDGAGGSPLSIRFQKMVSRFRSGSVCTIAGTQQKLELDIFKKRLKSLDDGFSNIILEIRYRSNNLLKGPIAELLLHSRELRETLVNHLEIPGRKIQVLVDGDTGVIQQVAAIDRQGYPRTLIQVIKPPSIGENIATTWSALYLTLGSPHSGIPMVSAKRYEFNCTAQKIISETSLPEPTHEGRTLSEIFATSEQGEFIHPKTFTFNFASGTPYEFLLDYSDTPITSWRIKDGSGQKLDEYFTTVPPEGPFPWQPRKTLPPPPPRNLELPGEEERTEATPSPAPERKPLPPPPPLPAIAMPAPSLEAVSRPEPVPSIMEGPSKTLKICRDALQELVGPTAPTPKEELRFLTLLAKGMERLPREEVLGFAAELEPHLETLFSFPNHAEGIIKKLFGRIPKGQRLSLAQKIVDLLGNPRPVVSVTAFSILRDSLYHLGNDDVAFLNDHLSRKFPERRHTLVTSMVHQVRLLFRGRLP